MKSESQIAVQCRLNDRGESGGLLLFSVLCRSLDRAWPPRLYSQSRTRWQDNKKGQTMNRRTLPMPKEGGIQRLSWSKQC